jgi:PST family polysaccharide transporter
MRESVRDVKRESSATTPLLARAARGALWSWSGQLLRQLLQLGVTALLARWLAPDDFGRWAMIGVATALLSLFGEWGIGPALIQRRELTRAHLQAAFWGSLIVGLMLMVVLLLAAPLVAAAYADAALVPLAVALAGNFPLVALATVPIRLLERELRFGRLALAETVALVLGGIVALGLASRGWGVWSLVGQTLAASCATAVAAWCLVPTRVREMGLPTGEARDAACELFRFGRSLVGINVLTFVARNADTALIGRVLGAHALGYYALAYRMMLLPLQNISWALGRALFPALAQLPDPASVRRAYRRVVEGIATVAFPMMIGMAIVAPEAIRLLYGPKWERAVFAARVLCGVGALQAIGTTIGPLCLSQGRPDILLRWNLIFVPILIGSIALGLPWGIEGVAVTYAGASLAAWYFSHALANRTIALPMGDFLRALAPAAASTLVMALGVIAVRVHAIRPWASSALPALIAQVGLGIGLYAFTLGRLRPEAFGQLRDLLRLIGRRTAPC